MGVGKLWRLSPHRILNTFDQQEHLWKGLAKRLLDWDNCLLAVVTLGCCLQSTLGPPWMCLRYFVCRQMVWIPNLFCGHPPASPWRETRDLADCWGTGLVGAGLGSWCRGEYCAGSSIYLTNYLLNNCCVRAGSTAGSSGLSEIPV